MKNLLLTLFKIALGVYVLLCIILYFFQEKLIFLPQRLDKNFEFKFRQSFEEMSIKTKDGKLLNGLLFKSPNSKGLIFYLHGNAGNLSSWGGVAEVYTALNYDVFMIDYRGYGKSEGSISSQNQLFEDNQIAYNELKKSYKEEQIIILGYSIGTGLASKLASENNPKLLILQAPYYSLTDMLKQRLAIIPSFLLKYKLANNEYLKSCKMPLVIFHGDADEVIYYGSSLKLQKEFKQGDILISLAGEGHNGMSNNPNYREELAKILARQ